MIAGSGRSGTSIMAATMGQLGFHLPQPEVEPDQTNPKGFGEPKWVVDFHNQLLRRVNIQVSDARPRAWIQAANANLDEDSLAKLRSWLENQFSISDRIIVKDPRLLWFLPLWERACVSLNCQFDVVTMLRHPAEVVHSKKTTSEINRLAGWVNTMLFTERGTRDHRRVFVQFDDMLKDWPREIARVSTALDAPSLLEASAQDQMRADAFIDRSLHRTQTTWEDVSAPAELVELAESIWTDLLSLAAGMDLSGATRRLDDSRQRYVALFEQAEALAESRWIAEVRPLKRQISQLQSKNRQLQATIDELRGTPDGLADSPMNPDVSTGSVVERAVRLVPVGVRHRIPLNLRKSVVRALRR